MRPHPCSERPCRSMIISFCHWGWKASGSLVKATWAQDWKPQCHQLVHIGLLTHGCVTSNNQLTPDAFINTDVFSHRNKVKCSYVWAQKWVFFFLIALLNDQPSTLYNSIVHNIRVLESFLYFDSKYVQHTCTQTQICTCFIIHTIVIQTDQTVAHSSRSRLRLTVGS